MVCKRCIKSIPKFLDDELDIDSLRDFIEHVECCEECKEELTIEFLVREGLNNLEEGRSFDLNKGLKARIEQAQKDLKSRESVRWFYYALAGMVAVGLCILILLLIVL